ncbi:MAG: putative nucleic-acid-binding protein [Candidatus Tokpelaia sp. JSC189]|nr:MAG: putative nucleic-acid-binding protein [Candidatus Tokpelaia sp. JSC189]
MIERTCIITRTCGSPDMMIRFVAGPDGLVMPDLTGRLPGRGAWLVPSRKVLEEAIRRKAFARSLKQDVRIADDMPYILDCLLTKAALQSLSLARRGRGVIIGTLKIITAIHTGDIKMVLHGTEAAKDGRRKIAQAIHAAGKRGVEKPLVVTLFMTEEMNLAFGDNNVIHAAITKSLAADGFIRRTRQLMAYRDENAMSWDEDMAKAVKEAE